MVLNNIILSDQVRNPQINQKLLGYNEHFLHRLMWDLKSGPVIPLVRVIPLDQNATYSKAMQMPAASGL